jgi:CubicO group peptidase (beta-lactamase class C family)
MSSGSINRRRTALMKTTKDLAALAAVTSVAMMVAGCGSSSPEPGKPVAAKPAVSRPLAYAECMRAHGVRDFPDPVDGHIVLTPASGINPSSPRFAAASSACVSLAPSGRTAGGTPSGTAGGAPGGMAGGAASGQHQAAGGLTVPAGQWRAFGAWLKRRAAAGQFSGAVLAAKNGTSVLDAGYGLAEREEGIAATSRTKFCIASIGKLFTAVAIAQLAEHRELSYGDTIGKFLSGFAPSVAGHVTIAELLDMTSGLGNVALARANPPATLAAMVKLISREHPRFSPGSRFLYSNDGYIVLGAVIQSVTGQSYDSYVQEHVLDPAGMTHTGLSVYTPARVPGMAHGYTLAGTTLRDDSTTPQIANPSGGAYSTVGDLLDFAQALTGHRLLNPAMTATVLTPRVNSPQPGAPPVDEYTYGFSYQAINGVTFVGHNGGTPGYEGQLDIYPETGYVVVMLTNQDETLVPAIQRSETMLTAS